MKVLLVCAAGMSTSLLVANMRKFAGKEDVIEAKSASELPKSVGNYEVVLVGPQIRHEFGKIKALCQKYKVKTGLIDMASYGKMDGRAAMELAKELINQK